MSLQTRRPTQLSFRVRRNFKMRDWTSIGQRRARVPSRKAGDTQTIPTLAGSNSSTTHGEQSRVVGFGASGSDHPPAAAAPSDKGWSEWLWLGLIMLAIAAAATVQLMQ
jgi:hypothetical protein